MGDSATSLRSTFSPSLDPPLPTGAVFTAPFGPVTVTFSHPLVNSPAIDPTNWFVRETNLDKSVSAAAVVGGVVVLTLAGVTPDMGPPVVSFTPPPFDVLSDTAVQVPAAAFSDFPLV